MNHRGCGVTLARVQLVSKGMWRDSARVRRDSERVGCGSNFGSWLRSQAVAQRVQRGSEGVAWLSQGEHGSQRVQGGSKVRPGFIRL